MLLAQEHQAQAQEHQLHRGRRWPRQWTWGGARMVVAQEHHLVVLAQEHPVRLMFLGQEHPVRLMFLSQEHPCHRRRRGGSLRDF